jgi:hypothetical protein
VDFGSDFETIKCPDGNIRRVLKKVEKLPKVFSLYVPNWKAEVEGALGNVLTGSDAKGKVAVSKEMESISTQVSEAYYLLSSSFYTAYLAYSSNPCGNQNMLDAWLKEHNRILRQVLSARRKPRRPSAHNVSPKTSSDNKSRYMQSILMSPPGDSIDFHVEENTEDSEPQLQLDSNAKRLSSTLRGVVLEEEVLNAMLHFSGQSVPGRLFGTSGQMRLPKFSQVLPHYRDRRKAIEVDALGIAPDSRWVVEVKDTRFVTHHVLDTLDSCKSLGNTEWLVSGQEPREYIRNVAAERGILITGPKEWEELKGILRIMRRQ